jgi:hypothetical protein
MPVAPPVREVENERWRRPDDRERLARRRAGQSSVEVRCSEITRRLRSLICSAASASRALALLALGPPLRLAWILRSWRSSTARSGPYVIRSFGRLKVIVKGLSVWMPRQEDKTMRSAHNSLCSITNYATSAPLGVRASKPDPIGGIRVGDRKVVGIFQ